MREACWDQALRRWAMSGPGSRQIYSEIVPAILAERNPRYSERRQRDRPSLSGSPRVTFVVPCYNYGNFVGQAIESILVQTFESLEIIVIDDASSDDSARIIERYQDDSRVRFVRHDQNKGHIYTYNEGLMLSRGEFVGLISADDFCARADAVQRQVDVFDANPNVGLVYSSYNFADHHSNLFAVIRPWDADHVWPGLKEFSPLLFNNYIPSSGSLVRRSCHEELGYYDDRLKHAGDWELWLRLAAQYDVAFIADPLYAYRTHRSNMHHTTVSPRQEIDEYSLMMQKVFNSLPPSTPRAVYTLRGLAVRNALLRSASHDCNVGRTKRGWLGLVYAARRSPGIVTSRAFVGMLGRLSLQGLIGHHRYVQLYQWRASIRMAS